MMDQILIDFRGGQHGNFLEFLLNKFYYAADWEGPFTVYGTSHAKPYNNLETKFYANHFTEHLTGKTPTCLAACDIFNKSNNIILITTAPKDLLLLMSVSLLRSGDCNIDNDLLEVDTFNKLNNRWYSSLLENINKSYNINCCKDNPNVPRYILREFFKFGFKDFSINGFAQIEKSAELQLHNKNVYRIPFADFYNLEKLQEQLTNISNYYKLELVIDVGALKQLHEKFLSGNRYLNIKSVCDDIIQAVIENRVMNMPKLLLFQESYINARLEMLYNKEMPLVQRHYFTNTQEIIDYLK